MIAKTLHVPLDSNLNSNLVKYITSNSYWASVLLRKESIRDDTYFFYEFEYHAFYKKYFETKSKHYEELLWTPPQANIFFDIDAEAMKPNKTRQVLLHFANLQNLRNSCKNFWESNLTPYQMRESFWNQSLFVRDIDVNKKSFSSLYFTKIQFHFENYYQVEITCSYIEYVFQKRLLLQENGNNELHTIVSLFTEHLGGVLESLRNSVGNIIKETFVNFWNQNKGDLTCQTILKTGNFIHSSDVEYICSKYVNDKFPFYNFLYDLFTNCESQSVHYSFNLDPETLSSFCFYSNPTLLTYSKMYTTVIDKLKDIYQVSTFNTHIMALNQLFKSTISLTINPYISEEACPQGHTIAPWYSNVFKNPFEISYFENKYNIQLFSSLKIEKIKALFAEGGILNLEMLYNILVKAANNDFSLLKKLLLLEEKDFSRLWKYMVLFVREYYFGGLFIEVSEKEIDEGIQADFFKDVKEKKILLGGNPNVEFPFEVGPKKKFDFQIAKHTGYSNYGKIDRIYEINNLGSINSLIPIFNGNFTANYYYTPWRFDIEINGCDNYCSEYKEDLNLQNDFSQNNKNQLHEVFRHKKPKPKEFLNSNDPYDLRNINRYYFLLNRTMQYNFVNTTNFNNTNLRFHHYDLDQNQYEPNDALFFQKDHQGFLNTTQVLFRPFLISQNHQYNVDSKISSKFDYFSKSGEVIIPEKEQDGGYYKTEESSFKVVESKMNFHYHIQIKPDLLFVNLENEIEHLKVEETNYYIAPLFNLEIKEFVNSSDFKTMFAGIIYVNDFKSAFEGYCIVLAFVCITVLGLLVYMFIRQRKKDSALNEDLSFDTGDRLIGHENLHMNV
jgi:hypothetical protein